MLTHVGAGDSQEADGVAVLPPKHCFVHEFSVERVFREKTKFELVSAHAKVSCPVFSDRSPTHTFEKWCCFPSCVVLRVNKNASRKNFHIKKKVSP